MATVQIQDSISVAAGATNANVIAGKKYERVPFDAYGTLYETGSAAGLFSTLTVGMLNITDTARVNANNRIPIDPDDETIAGFECPEGNLVQLTVYNSTGGALTYAYRLVFVAADTGQE